jgi:hypothetical protein
MPANRLIAALGRLLHAVVRPVAWAEPGAPSRVVGDPALPLFTFGFFHHLARADAIKELQRSRSEKPRPNERRVLAYLKGGAQVFLIPGIDRDLLAKTERRPGPPGVYTDGVWVWSADVVYYIEQYHIDIPEGLRLRMEQNGWVCPPVVGAAGFHEEIWAAVCSVGRSKKQG